MAQHTQQSTNSNTPAIVSDSTALAANPARTHWMIQNLGTNVLFVLMGSGASTTVFHVVLKGGTGNDDGIGASYSSDAVCYTGIISIAGTSPRYTVTEIAP